MLRAAIYARVSSSAQRDAHTIENQLRALPAFVKAKGWILVDTYIDDGRSAKTGKLEAREGFARLLKDAEAKRFDVLVVVDVDRLTRTNSMEERAAILGPFQRLGITIATPSGEYDLDSMIGGLYVELQARFAAEENRKRSERITSGKLRAIAEGRKPAGPTPFGLAYDREAGAWSIDPVRGPIVREIYDRIIAGDSCLEIARDLHARDVAPPRGPWSRHKVWQIARAGYPAGEWTADKARKLSMLVPAILTERTWQRAQAKLIEHGKRGLRKTMHVYLLEGLGVCSRCGSPIAIRSATGGRRGRLNPAAYLCRARKIDRIGHPRCDAPIMPVADVDARVWAAVADALNSEELADELARRAAARADNRRSWREDIASHKRHLKRLAESEAGTLARNRRGLVSDEALDIELGALRRERGAVRDQLATAERGARDSHDDLGVPAEAWLGALRELARSCAPEMKQRAVRAVIARGDAVFACGVVELTIGIEAGAASRDVSADTVAVSAVGSF